ncbi:MAG: stage III sporulation protein AB [Ruminococcus sp.]|nr:stage III sporulation protein AB [Ruminococcus sp.]
MLKLTGLLCIVLCGAGCGMAAASALKRQAVFCKTLCLFLEELEILMRWNGDTLPVLVDMLSQKPGYAPLRFLKEIRFSESEPFSDAWRRAILEEHGLPEELSQLLLSLGDSLGTSDLEGQMKTLEGYQLQARHISRNAEEQYRTKGKLYRSMGILGGMSAALLLC